MESLAVWSAPVTQRSNDCDVLSGPVIDGEGFFSGAAGSHVRCTCLSSGAAFSWNVGAATLTATPMDGKGHDALGAGAKDAGVRARGDAARHDGGSARTGRPGIVLRARAATVRGGAGFTGEPRLINPPGLVTVPHINPETR